MNGPKIGTVEDGYMFKGGNPADPNSWVSVDDPAVQFALRPEPVVGFGEQTAAMPFTEGFFAGFAGELGGGVKAATDWLAAQAEGKDIPYGELYDVNRAIMEGQIQQYAEGQPGLSTGLEIAGAIPSGLMLPGSQVTTMPRMMAAGAGYGGLYGAGKAEDISDIPSEATKGALMGAATPPLIRGGLMMGRGLARGAQATAMGASRIFSQSDDAAARPALKAIDKAFERDGMTLAQANKQLQKLGPDAVLADVGGKNVQKLANEVASLPGKSAEIAEQTLQSRMAQSVPRLAGALKKALGAKSTAYRASKDIISQRNAQAGPLYEEAFTQMANRGRMDDLINQLSLSADEASGTKIGRNIRSVLNSLTKKEAGQVVPKTNMKQLHMAKMDLDGQIGTAIKAGNKPLSAELMKIKTALLEVMDEVPQYQQARQIFSDYSSVLSSIDLGKKVLTTDAEEMADMVNYMSKADLDGYILGATKAITDKLKGAGQTANAANRISTHIVRDRMRNAFPSDEAFEQFMKQVDIENTFAELRNVTIRGSQTAERLGTRGELAVDALAAGVEGNLYSKIMGGVADWISQFKQIPEATRDSIGTMLFSDIAKTGQISDRLYQRAVKAGLKREQLQQLTNNISASIARPAIAYGQATEAE